MFGLGISFFLTDFDNVLISFIQVFLIFKIPKLLKNMVKITWTTQNMKYSKVSE